MDTAEILRNILIVLVAAKLAAEVAERIGIPAVVGEIVAGILIGPSLLNAVGEGDEVLRTLGEIGVILLLLDVGLEMDLKELGKVGRTSLQVATVGVVAPLVLGLGGHVDHGRGLQHGALRRRGAHRDERGHHRSGVRRPARARHPRGPRGARRGRRRRRHGPRRAHRRRSPRHRGIGVAAVGRSGSSRWPCSSSPSAACSACASPRRCSPPSTASRGQPGTARRDRASRSRSRSPSWPTWPSWPRSSAPSSPASRCRQADQSERIRRDLTPVGHLFIPVFFLQIGIDADITAFGSGEVLRDAAHPPRGGRGREAAVAARARSARPATSR